MGITSVNDNGEQIRHREFVRMVDELMQIKSCHKTQIALAGGFTPNNFMAYYANTKAVSKKTLARVKALYDVPISKPDTVATIVKEYRELKYCLNELKQQNAQILQEIKEIYKLLQE